MFIPNGFLHAITQGWHGPVHGLQASAESPPLLSKRPSAVYVTMKPMYFQTVEKTGRERKATPITLGAVLTVCSHFPTDAL